jgi:hypothetical protein
MTSTLMGNTAQSPAPSTMWPGACMSSVRRKRRFSKRLPGQTLVQAKSLLEFTQQASAPGTDGSGRARVHCYNLFLSRWALICPAKSRLWVPGFPGWRSETRFSA